MTLSLYSSNSGVLSLASGGRGVLLLGSGNAVLSLARGEIRTDASSPLLSGNKSVVTTQGRQSCSKNLETGAGLLTPH